MAGKAMPCFRMDPLVQGHITVCVPQFLQQFDAITQMFIVEKSCLLASVASAQGSFGLTRIRHVLKRECHVLKVGSEASVLKSFNRFHRRSIFTVQHIRRQQHHPRSPTSRSRIKDARQHSSREQGSDQHLLALDGWGQEHHPFWFGALWEESFLSKNQGLCHRVL